MSISSSLFSGISGLSTNGDAMSVIGDNIANVNTIGFKASRTTFQDVLSQSVATAAGTAQIGRGTALSDVSTLFQQGSFESTSSATDLAIGGNGFFIVRDPGAQTEYYTRAGQFRFDKDGNFINPSGYIVRGWALDDSGNDVGTIQDVVLSSFTSPPQATAEITAITNLDTTDTSHSDSLFDTWDATATEPLADTTYGYQTAIRVYDSLGNSHDITIFYDKLNAASEYNDGSVDIDNSWEYIVTCNPSEDLRGDFSGLSEQGILMRGSLTYSSSTGDLTSFSAFTYDDTSGDPTDDANWVTATFSTNGYAQLTARFVAGVDQDIEIMMGLRSTDSTWVGSTDVADITDGAGTDVLPYFVGREPQAMISTQYASSSTTVYQSQDGYGTGFLENISVDTDGVMVGHYSNGQILNLYRVALAKFNNAQALNKEGGNLYAATRASGSPITGHPGENGLGRVSPNSLEQSNVDIAAEFVKMITTQRGFQANSRVITTTDDMLRELINLKR
ncbi:MAG: flagellar hook protein FlgE [Deltaproteobacteria bacterium]|nr:flagellar hook protein FlgE [Deltaproteobacteria bacterium]